MIYVSPYNDGAVIAGQGTCGVEIVDDLPGVDAVFVAVGCNREEPTGPTAADFNTKRAALKETSSPLEEATATVESERLYHREDYLAEATPDYRPVEVGDYDTHFGSLWFRRVS